MKTTCPKCNHTYEVKSVSQTRDTTYENAVWVLEQIHNGVRTMKGVMSKAREVTPSSNGIVRDKWARNAAWRLRNAGLIVISRAQGSNIKLIEELDASEWLTHARTHVLDFLNNKFIPMPGGVRSEHVVMSALEEIARLGSAR